MRKFFVIFTRLFREFSLKLSKHHEQFIQTQRYLRLLKMTYLHGSEQGVVGGLNARWRGLGEVHHGGEGSRRQGTRTEIPKAQTRNEKINQLTQRIRALVKRGTKLCARNTPFFYWLWMS